MACRPSACCTTGSLRREAVDTLAQNVPTEVGELHLIGDAQAPRRLMDAILDGARIGRLL